MAFALWVLLFCGIAFRDDAQEQPNATTSQNASSTARSNPPAGLLPVPDYSGDFWTRQFLTGDWGGLRTNLANHGVQIGVEWDQFVPGVTNGGRDQGTEYGANLNY